MRNNFQVTLGGEICGALKVRDLRKQTIPLLYHVHISLIVLVLLRMLLIPAKQARSRKHVGVVYSWLREKAPDPGTQHETERLATCLS